MFNTLWTRPLPIRAARPAILLSLWTCSAGIVVAQLSTGSPSIVHMVESNSDRLEMTIHTSRMLTLELKVPRAQVNNPDLLDLTPVSAKQVQIYAKKAGRHASQFVGRKGRYPFGRHRDQWRRARARDDLAGAVSQCVDQGFPHGYQRDPVGLRGSAGPHQTRSSALPKITIRGSSTTSPWAALSRSCCS